jgi:hypothetical protein
MLGQQVDVLEEMNHVVEEGSQLGKNISYLQQTNIEFQLSF